MVEAAAQSIWYCIEEPDGAVYTENIKDRTLSVLMTTFHVKNMIATGTMYGTG